MNIRMHGATIKKIFLNCLALQDETDRLSRNAGNHLSINAACNIAEALRPHLHRSGIIKSRTLMKYRVLLRMKIHNDYVQLQYFDVNFISQLKMIRLGICTC